MKRQWTWVVSGFCLAVLTSACVGPEPKIAESKDGQGGSSSPIDGGSDASHGGAAGFGGIGTGGNGAAGGAGGNGAAGGAGGTGAAGGAGGTGGNPVTPCVSASTCAAKESCIANAWCSPICLGDADCGTSPSGEPNHCVQNQAGNSICFPGCRSKSDCDPFSDTSCLEVVGGTGTVCAAASTSAPMTGDPCLSDDDCGSLVCIGSWCSPLTCATDDDCGPSSSGQANHCIQNTNNDFYCFPACTTDASCTAFPFATCFTGATPAVCSVPSTVCYNLNYDTEECATCACGTCGDESKACAADPNCLAFIKCYGACAGDSTCESTCVTKVPAASTSVVTDTANCLGNSCGTCAIPIAP